MITDRKNRRPPGAVQPERLDVGGAILARRVQYSRNIQVRFQMRSKGIQRGLDACCMGVTRWCRTQISQKGGAKGVVGKHTVQIAAHHASISADSTFVTGAETRKGACAIRPFAAPDVNFIALQGLA